MKSLVKTVLVLAALSVAFATNTAGAIIMRHDASEERYLRLANEYPATASVRPADAVKGLGGEGTLIAPLWILTAAHVAAELGPDDLVEVNRVTVRIDRVFLHPEWHRDADVKRVSCCLT